MKVFLTIFTLTLLMVSTRWVGEDYCKIPCNGRHHIACKNNGDFGPKCEEGVELVVLSDEVKEKFVQVHNDLRNEVASGKMEGYDSAARMASMTWDDELAYLAELSVKKCDMRRDKCRNTKKYSKAGQNVGTFGGVSTNPESAISFVFQLWRSDWQDTPMAAIDKYTKSPLRSGQFAILVNERNFKIGCAILNSPQWGMTQYIMACNYPRDSLVGEKIYKRGKPASECKTGAHPIYDSLCSPSETYDV